MRDGANEDVQKWGLDFTVPEGAEEVTYHIWDNSIADIILILHQPIDRYDSYNFTTRRQAPLLGGKPACSRFPRLTKFYLPSLSIERCRISISFVLSGSTYYYTVSSESGDNSGIYDETAEICNITEEDGTLEITKSGYYRAFWNGEKYYYCLANTNGADVEDGKKRHKCL